MSESTELPQEQRDNLVAYLDGELNDETTQGIEQSLARSAKVRQEVEALRVTWDMLDHLPRTRASDEFTEKTLSTIKTGDIHQQVPDTTRRNRARNGVVWAVGAAGLVLAAGLGFFATNRWVSTEADDLVRELPVIERFEVYTEVGSVEFLRELQESGVFDEELQ